jgi:hypothetical protein
MTFQNLSKVFRTETTRDYSRTLIPSARILR